MSDFLILPGHYVIQDFLQFMVVWGSLRLFVRLLKGIKTCSHTAGNMVRKNSCDTLKLGPTHRQIRGFPTGRHQLGKLQSFGLRSLARG